MSIRVGLRPMGRALGVVAAPPPPPVFPMDYVFTEGTVAPYDVMYDTVHPVPATPVSIAQSELYYVTYSNAARKLVRLSDGTLYEIYGKQLAGKYQVYVKKSEDDGATWTDETLISTYTDMEDYDQERPSIAVDSDDCLHVLWHGMATGYIDFDKVWYAEYTDAWAAPECLQPTGLNKYPNIRWSRWP